jgi:hypothetical protein
MIINQTTVVGVSRQSIFMSAANGSVALDGEDRISFIGNGNTLAVDRCAEDTISVQGTNQNLWLILSDSIAVDDRGNGLALVLQPGVVRLTVEDFTHDARGTVWLPKGTPELLAPDGHGGTVLNGEADFVGMKAATLAARVHFF